MLLVTSVLQNKIYSFCKDQWNSHTITLEQSLLFVDEYGFMEGNKRTLVLHDIPKPVTRQAVEDIG